VEGSGCGVVGALSWYLLEVTENDRNTSVRISCVPAEIRTEHLPTRSPERYHYSRSFDQIQYRKKYSFMYFNMYESINRSRDSVVGIANGYGLDN
jgi:hypothetical protein